MGWELSDATSLLATVTYLQRVLARSISDGPELLAHQLLSEHAPLGSASSVEQAPGEQAGEMLGTHLTWMRPLTIAEQRQRYLHCYTHLSYALEACLRLPLPEGSCESSPAGRAYDGQRPGVWRVQAERAGSIFDGTLLPAALEGGWMTTPQVQCCHAIGYQIQVCEGSFWLRSRPALHTWAQTLWQAAERVQGASPLFKHEQGRLNTASSLTLLARLGLAQFTGGPQAAWGTQIVAGSRAVLFAHLVRLVRRGVMPVLLSGDALWVVSNDPSPRSTAPTVLDARPWNGYRRGIPRPACSLLPGAGPAAHGGLSRAGRSAARRAGARRHSCGSMNTIHWTQSTRAVLRVV